MVGFLQSVVIISVLSGIIGLFFAPLWALPMIDRGLDRRLANAACTVSAGMWTLVLVGDGFP